MQPEYVNEVRRTWDRARRKALWSRVTSNLRGKTVGLRDFNEVSQRLRLRTAFYRGVQMVPMNQIVGSVGRYKDFAGAFLPLTDTMGDRWRMVATLYLNPLSNGVPPIELFKVGEFYFVKDGNHRVSVCRQLKMDLIEAHVWEYDLPGVQAAPGADIDTFLIDAERRDFLNETRLDELRPGHDIRFSEPGGYTWMLCQISHYQDVLSQVDNAAVAYEDAVTAWYDMLYTTTIQIIRESNVLADFPNRTPADFFVWVSRHQDELIASGQRRLMVRDAALILRRQKRSRIRAFFERWFALLRNGQIRQS